MHTAGKVFLGLGGAVAVFGIVMMIMGGSAIGDSFDVENDNAFEGTSGQFYTDGSEDFVIYIKDDIDCTSVTVTITNDDTGEDHFVADEDCDKAAEEDPVGFRSIGLLDWNYDRPGNYTVTASEKIYLVSLWDELGGLAGGIFQALSGAGMIACGACFLLLGGILALVLNDPKEATQMQTPPTEGYSKD
jgi:hypothetical protein